MKLLRRIEKYTRFTDRCWLWIGSTDDDGYARMSFMYRDYRVHRLMYELCRSLIPRELVIDHLCRVRSCINPYHLEVVTNRTNIQRGERATATHCKKGHPYSGDNLAHNIDSQGYTYRRCRQCSSISDKELRQDPVRRAAKNLYRREWRATKKLQGVTA